MPGAGQIGRPSPPWPSRHADRRRNRAAELAAARYRRTRARDRSLGLDGMEASSGGATGYDRRTRDARRDRRASAGRTHARCWPMPAWQRPRRRSAIARPSAATCCRRPGAPTFGPSRPCLGAATSARPGSGCAALRWLNERMAILGWTDAASPPSPPIRWSRWLPRCRGRADTVPTVGVRCRSPTFTGRQQEAVAEWLDAATPRRGCGPAKSSSAPDLPVRAGAALGLRQGARTSELRVRAGLGRRRDQDRGRPYRRGADRARFGGAAAPGASTPPKLHWSASRLTPRSGFRHS